LSCLVLSCLVLSCLVLLVLSCLVLSCLGLGLCLRSVDFIFALVRFFFVLPWWGLSSSFLVLSCNILLSCLVLSWRGVASLVLILLILASFLLSCLCLLLPFFLHAHFVCCLSCSLWCTVLPVRPQI
jgi:hypothetical protein